MKTDDLYAAQLKLAGGMVAGSVICLGGWAMVLRLAAKTTKAQ